jgi:LPXTG-motif cell wall-anchored protein
VEERESEIPKGYRLKGYQRVEGSYIGDSNSGTIRDNSDPSIEVHNQRGWGLSLEKVWSDADYMESHDPVYFGVYVPGEKGEPVLLDGSLRQLTTDQTSLYWYFDTIEEGVSFDRYNVYEVALTNPKTDDEGKVTSWDQIRMLDEGDQITIGGTAKGKDHVADGYTYSISCSRGELTGSSDKVKNVRTDQITNSRTGVLIKKVDGEGQPLAGAKFTLKDSKGNDLGAPSYVSDKEGMVTLACLEKGETYILTETETPKGYQSMLEEDKVKICLEDDGSVTVNGAADSGNAYTITQGDGAAMPEIAIINKPFIFEARKIDAESRLPMADVRFRLFSQVFDLDGQPVKDYLPIMGFDRLVTDDKGVIPRIDGNLEPGTYYLSEIAAPEGYEALAEDICLSISRTGKVNLENVDLLTWLDKKEEDGKIRYTLMVSNMRKRTVQIVKRGSDSGVLLAEAVFSLYSEDKVEGDKPKADSKPDITGTTEEAGTVDLGTLAPGTYYLFEDEAPEGYEALEAPVIIKVEPGRFTASYLDSPLEVNDLKPGLRQVTVWNHSGYELPSSGGIGTWIYRFLGGLILAGALLLYHRRRTLN